MEVEEELERSHLALLLHVVVRKGLGAAVVHGRPMIEGGPAGRVCDMPSTVLITGASSGIGRASVDAFLNAGWNVVATMRSPDEHAELAARKRTLVTRLDVTERASIEAAIAETLNVFGGLDCVVNNAGFALVGPLEGATEEEVRRQVETNLFGVVSLCQTVLPTFRAQGRGTIVNVTSVGGRVTFPLYSLYHATKWALEGLSESLQFELRPLGIRVRIVEPGPIRTDFYSRSMSLTMGPDLEDYQRYVDSAVPYMLSVGEGGASPDRVARTIVRAASSRGWKLRWPADRRARMLLWLRRLLPDRVFIEMIRRAVAG